MIPELDKASETVPLEQTIDCSSKTSVSSPEDTLWVEMAAQLGTIFQPI